MTVLSVKFMQLFLVMVLLLPIHLAHAQSAEANGHITVRSAQLTDSVGGWLLSADVAIELPREIRQGLDSGVPLHFIIEFYMTQARDFLPDKRLISVERRYTLTYYELTRHYRLHSVEQKQSKNYRSLLAATDDLGNIQGLAIERTPEFEVNGPVDSRLSMRLDSKALPLPLQPIFSSTWRLASEEFTWSLN